MTSPSIFWLARSLCLPMLMGSLAGCSVITVPIRDAVEQAESVPAGSRVAGAGFSVQSPKSGYHVVRDQPRPGYLCLRASTRDMFLGEGSYNVLPFTLDTPAATLRDAFTANAFMQFDQRLRAQYHILNEHVGTWRGQPAYFQDAFSQQSPSGGGAVISSCVIQRGAKYYWIVRSVPVINNRPDTLQRANQRTSKELRPFLDSMMFDPPVNG